MSDVPAQEIDLFAAAIELPVAERAAYLDRACSGDVDLRQRVDGLLKEHDDLGDSPGKRPSKGTAQGGPRAIGEKPGDRIGHYKLLQQIGEGGGGVVYMAEQEAPVRRRGALKIIKPGIDTKSVITPFEAERQAPAVIEHPHIANGVFSGATE